jgi:hypothetical protein
MQLEEFLQDAINDRLEGWELVEFLQVPIADILLAALENDWLNEENIEEVLEEIGLERRVNPHEQ